MENHIVGKHSLPESTIKPDALNPIGLFFSKLNDRIALWVFVGYVIAMAFTLYSSWWGLLQYCAHVIEKQTLALLIIPALICAILFSILLIYWKGRPERVFLLIALPALGSFALFIMPNWIPDEIWHIFRIFDLHIAGSEMSVPYSIDAKNAPFPTDYASLYSALIAQPDWDNTVIVSRDLSAYLIHLYAIPSLVVNLCEILNINPIASVFLARISNGILFLLAGYWIIKHIPIGKTLVLVYLLNPMLVQQEASCSADVIVNVVSLMFVAYLLQLKFQKKPIKARQAILLMALLIITSLSKYVYALLGFLLLMLVPRLSRRTTRNTIYALTAICTVSCAGAILLFYSEAGGYYDTVALIKNPTELLYVMTNSIREIGPIWVEEMFGFNLGALNIEAWKPCFWAYCLLLLFSIVFNLGEKRCLSRSEKIFVCVLTFLSITATILLFRGWTLAMDNRADVIMGAQGRYFIPFAILPLLAAISPQASLYRKNILIFVACVLVVIYLLDILTIFTMFN